MEQVFIWKMARIDFKQVTVRLNECTKYRGKLKVKIAFLKRKMSNSCLHLR